MIAFEVSPRSIDRIAKEVAKILDENDIIEYEILNIQPHITIAQMPGVAVKDELVRDMQKLSVGFRFNPKNIKRFHGPIVHKDFIVIQFRSNKQFDSSLKSLMDKYEVRQFKGGIKPHLSIIRAPEDSITDEVMKQVEASVTSLPKVKPVGISLFNKEFNIEVRKR